MSSITFAQRVTATPDTLINVIEGESVEGKTVPNDPASSGADPGGRRSNDGRNQPPSSGPVIIAGEIEEQPEP